MSENGMSPYQASTHAISQQMLQMKLVGSEVVGHSQKLLRKSRQQALTSLLLGY